MYKSMASALPATIGLPHETSAGDAAGRPAESTPAPQRRPAPMDKLLLHCAPRRVTSTVSISIDGSAAVNPDLLYHLVRLQSAGR